MTRVRSATGDSRADSASAIRPTLAARAARLLRTARVCGSSGPRQRSTSAISSAYCSSAGAGSRVPYQMRLHRVAGTCGCSGPRAAVPGSPVPAARPVCSPRRRPRPPRRAGGRRAPTRSARRRAAPARPPGLPRCRSAAPRAAPHRYAGPAGGRRPADAPPATTAGRAAPPPPVAARPTGLARRPGRSLSGGPPPGRRAPVLLGAHRGEHHAPAGRGGGERGQHGGGEAPCAEEDFQVVEPQEGSPTAGGRPESPRQRRPGLRPDEGVPGKSERATSYASRDFPAADSLTSRTNPARRRASRSCGSASRRVQAGGAAPDPAPLPVAPPFLRMCNTGMPPRPVGRSRGAPPFPPRVPVRDPRRRPAAGPRRLP